MAASRIYISFQELTDTKEYLDNHPRHRNAFHNGRNRIISEESKRKIIRDLTPAKQPRNRHSKEPRNSSSHSNQGILRIPKEIDSILRYENAKYIRRRSSGSSTEDNWERLCHCATQLEYLCKQKECAATANKFFPRAKSLSEEMCQLAAHIIQSDYEFCETHSVEYDLWHKGVFLVTECLKEKSKLSNENSKEFHSFLLSMRDYYAALISSVQSNYSFSISAVDSISSIQTETEQKKILRGILTCHFCYLALGDIFVYLLVLRERNPDAGVSQEYDWSAVTGYYQKALLLSPTNGSTYTQLSILSSNQQYYLDTVYYSIRSLTAHSPILDGSESLVHLFHSIEKKSASLQSKGREVSPVTPPRQANQCDNEVWIIPENSFKLTTDSEITPKEKTDLKKTAPVKKIASPVNFQQLFKDVYFSFLTIHAKLYTNIGVDSVSDWLSVFDCSLSSLLKNRCNQSLSEILLKMQLVALYALTNQNTPSKSAQQWKVDFLFSFHFLLIQSMHRNIQPESSVPSHTWHLLPHIRVFTQWMRNNMNLLLDYLQTFSNHRLWDMLHTFANQLTGLQLSTETPADSNTFLWEDQMLSGCVLTDKFINTRASWAAVQLCVEDGESVQHRISLIISNLKTITEIPNFPISFDSKLSLFTRHTCSQPEDNNNTNTNINKPDPQLTHISTFENSLEQKLESDEENLSGETEATGELLLLKSEKDRLSEQVDKQTSEIHKHKQQTRTKHEITPRYIVPDTNCFLSYLSILQQLHTDTSLQLVVPLIVLQELEHLRIPISKSQRHLASCSKAKDAYTWLIDEFSKRSHSLQALTNQGNLIANPYSQDFTGVRNQINDDLILQSCVKLNQTWHSPSDTHCARSCVVLLTSDRNLRLKAVYQSLPAKSIKRFLTLINYNL